MAWDIYGQPLRPGHCEVHPHVHEEYPCSVCLAEAQAQGRNKRHDDREYYRAIEQQQYPLPPVVLSYGADFVNGTWVTIEATQFDNQKNPTSWAIRHGNLVMGTGGGYIIEPQPSSRDDEFLQAYRFPSAEAAFHHYKNGPQL